MQGPQGPPSGTAGPLEAQEPPGPPGEPGPPGPPAPGALREGPSKQEPEPARPPEVAVPGSAPTVPPGVPAEALASDGETMTPRAAAAEAAPRRARPSYFAKAQIRAAPVLAPAPGPAPESPHGQVCQSVFSPPPIFPLPLFS